MDRPPDALRSPDFRALFESAPGLYLVLDPDFVIVAATEAYLRATMTRREDILGKGIFEVFPDNPDDPQADGVRNLRASLERVLQAVKPDRMRVQKYDIRRPREAGGAFEVRYWSLLNTPVLGGEGKLAYIIHRVEDVTDFVRLKRHEAELARLNKSLQKQAHRLETEVSSRGREAAQASALLKTANEALQCSNQNMQHFAHMAAHDLQAPLNCITGCAQLLREESAGKLSEQAQQYLFYMLDSSQRMQVLIQDLLVYSRLECHIQPFEPVNLRLIFDEVLFMLAKTIAAAGATVTCADLPTLRVDRGQMTLVLLNLIENGIKYRQEKEPPRLEVSAELRGEGWLFAVRDNGMGIDPRFHEQIFEIFRRLHAYSEIPGTGIGLAICQRIVSRHGGRIWVESQEGEGSTFYFTLPADQDNNQP